MHMQVGMMYLLKDDAPKLLMDQFEAIFIKRLFF